jgi:hypothetical protein
MVSVVPAPTPMNTPGAQLMTHLACSLHGGMHCWIPGAADFPTIEHYQLDTESHIAIVDAELSKWIDELVCITHLMLLFDQ